MAHNNTVLSQMLQLLPRHVLEHQVETHSWQGPRPRKLSYWSQLVAMLYAQLSAKKSLRDLVFSLDRHRQKLYHLGLTPAKRSTLAEANEKRPALIFQKTYEKLLARFQAEAGRQPEARRVKILDATYVPVCASLFPWANFQPSKNAVKLHVLLDSVGAPQDLQVTAGQVHELEVARRLDFARGRSGAAGPGLCRFCLAVLPAPPRGGVCHPAAPPHPLSSPGGAPRPARLAGVGRSARPAQH